MYNISFTGINVSKANLLNHKLDIYRLSEADRDFISHLQKKINLKKLYPDIKQEDYQIYDFFLKRGLYNAIDKNREGFLLACDNIPCGIMANTPGKSSYYVNYICTWPVRPNQKAPFGAQTLFLHIFNNLLQKGINYIELNATRFGNAVTKYRRLGFKSYGGDNYTEVMKINKERMKNSIDILKGKIDLQLACNNEEFDLFKILKPNTLY